LANQSPELLQTRLSIAPAEPSLHQLNVQLPASASRKPSTGKSGVANTTARSINIHALDGHTARRFMGYGGLENSVVALRCGRSVNTYSLQAKSHAVLHSVTVPASRQVSQEWRVATWLYCTVTCISSYVQRTVPVWWVDLARKEKEGGNSPSAQVWSQSWTRFPVISRGTRRWAARDEIRGTTQSLANQQR
jgi:hypothetical protein